MVPEDGAIFAGFEDTLDAVIGKVAEVIAYLAERDQRLRGEEVSVGLVLVYLGKDKELM